MTAIKKPGRTGRPGHLAQAARDLGYNHSHLWRVVKGQRISPPTLRMYLKWEKTNQTLVCKGDVR